jgi:hypothetical protein
MEDEKGNPKIDKDLSKPISRQRWKLALGVKTTTGTQRVKEMTNKPAKKDKIDW